MSLVVARDRVMKIEKYHEIIIQKYHAMYGLILIQVE